MEVPARQISMTSKRGRVSSNKMIQINIWTFGLDPFEHFLFWFKGLPTDLRHHAEHSAFKSVPPGGAANPSPPPTACDCPERSLSYDYDPSSFAAISHLANVCAKAPALHPHLRALKLLLNGILRMHLTGIDGKSLVVRPSPSRIWDAALRQAQRATTARPILLITIDDDHEIIPSLWSHWLAPWPGNDFALHQTSDLYYLSSRKSLI